MSLQELIELAILDAMGLLDEREQAGFEAAFRTASPVVQAQVRREQTRLSRIEALLPDVTPPAGLRAAVIEAVRAQIASGTADQKELVLPYILKSRTVSPLWRASALGLAAAAVVFGITTFQWKHEYDHLQEVLRGDNVILALNNQFGASYVRDVLFAPDTRRVVFKPVTPGFKGAASVFLHPEWKEAKFFAESMTTPEGRPYRLAVIDDEDHIVQVLDTITSDGRLFSKDIAIKTAQNHLAIVGPADATTDNMVVLSRADLKS
jgi:hypothetical protein